MVNKKSDFVAIGQTKGVCRSFRLFLDGFSRTKHQELQQLGPPLAHTHCGPILDLSNFPANAKGTLLRHGNSKASLPSSV